MTDSDEILNAAFVYSEQEVLAEFQASCEAEAEEPGKHWDRVKHATLDLCQMLDRRGDQPSVPQRSRQTIYW